MRSRPKRKNGLRRAISRIRIWPPQIARLFSIAVMLGVLGAVLISVATAAVPTPAAPAAESFLQSLTEEERAWLRDHPVIRVAQDPSWPPIEFARQGGEPSGMTRDYLSLIEQRLGLKFEPVLNLSWQEAYARMKRWEVDMTTTVATTTEREAFWAFTKPYMTIPIVVVTRSDVTYIGDLRELEGRKVVVVDGYVSNDWISRDFPGIQLVRVDTTQEALAMLERGEVFACVENMLVVSHYLAELRLTGLKISGSTPYVNAQRMAVRKDWAPLAGILDKALDSISRTERNAIYRKWLPVRYEYGFDYTRFWAVAALLAVALLGWAAWNWKRADGSRGPLPGELRLWQAYLFAISATAAAFGLRLALIGQLGGRPTLVIFTLPIVLSAYLGGMRAGLLATALTSFGAGYYLMPPIHSFAVASNVERWQLFFMALAGVFISVLSELLHRARGRAEFSSRQHQRAEAANLRALERLTEAQRVGQIGDWDFEPATGNITWSPQTFEILGRDPSLGPPRNYEENAALYEPESAALMSEKVAQAIASGEAQEYELVALRPDGSRVQLQARAVPLADESGNVSSLHGTVQDISASKQAEAAVRVSEDRYRTLFERAPDGIVIVDSGGRYVDVNAAICQMLGYTRGEMIGRHTSTVVLPEEVPHLQEAFDELGTGADYHREWQFRRKDGSVFSADAVATQLPDGKVIGILRDITERKQAEAALRESEGKLRKVIDGLGPYMFVGLVTPDGVLVEANRPALEAAGLQPEDVLGKPFAETYWWAWSEAVQAQLRAAIARAVAGESSRYDVELRLAEGAICWVDFSLFPVCDPGGDVIFLVPSANVIDKRKTAEARVQQLNAALEQRVRERTAQLEQLRDLSRRLSGMEETERRNISRELHDRVGPNLVALKLSLGMMHTALPADGSDTGALEDAREVLEETIAQLRNVMADLRPPALDDYGLLAAIRSYAERYGARLDAEVRVEGADLAPRPSVAVETAMFRIAQEALNNIAKHSQARRVVIAAHRNASGITLTITDDGVGFDAATVAGSDGLGLKTMRERAQGLGAEFSIESRPGGPTCIGVHLASAPT